MAVIQNNGGFFDGRTPAPDLTLTGSLIAGSTNQDEAQFSIVLPFAFTFYGTSYSTVYADTNGALYFGSDANIDFNNSTLPSSNISAPVMLPFWDDLYTTDGIYTQSFGNPGDRRFVIQWNADTYNSKADGNAGKFQVILYEKNNLFNFNYLDVNFGNSADDKGASATIGTQEDSTNAALWSYNSNANLADTRNILYSPYADTFNDGNFNTLWLSSNGAYLNGDANAPTTTTGQVGGAVFFNGSGVRSITSEALDFSNGGNIRFSFAKGDGSLTNWQTPGVGENIYYQYSTDNGSNWTTITDLDTGSSAWTAYSVLVPDAARTATTSFRWIQLSNSGQQQF